MQSSTQPDIHLSRRTLMKIAGDPEKSATAISLVYVHDQEKGIKRVKRNNKFQYYLDDERITDPEQIARINSLAIPPSWENVWICQIPNGHLQATGLDKKYRKQYRYHPLWTQLRSQTKFYRLHEFGKALPAIRKKVEEDLKLEGLPVNKVLALLVSLMERTHIRVGSHAYEKMNGSFGLTTLKNQHVQVSGNRITFSFRGKKGVDHHLSVRSARLARLVQSCKEIPGKELFQYIDDHGHRHSINSGMVNDYIRTAAGENFTAKDFRTWAGTLHALIAFKECGITDTENDMKKKIVEVLDAVSKFLGNTRTVCKKYYVHPAVIQLYENNGLDKYTSQLDQIESHDHDPGLTSEEKVLMKILNITT